MRPIHCLLLLLLVLVDPVWSTASIRERIAGRFGLPTSTEATSSDTDNQALECLPVPLPALPDDSKNKALFKRPQKPLFDVISLRAPVVRRSRRQQPQSTARTTRKRQGPSGTRFAIRPPSPELISQWFAPAEEGWRRKRKRLASLFNHDSVGMTNPMLGISSLGSPTNSQTTVVYDAASSSASVSLASSSSTTTTTTTTTNEQFELEESLIPASSNGNTQQQSPDQKEANQWARVLQYKLRPESSSRQAAETAWFPSTQQQQQQQQQQQTTKQSKRKWRQCRYRRRVGQGQACYERVRDAALQWQFQNKKEGILPVSASEGSSCFALDPHASQQVLPIWSGPDTAGSRRLVTFTTCGFKTKWLPKLYALNPVMVVYDLLDQRGQGTTFSSTAYSTLKGHLLSGEERVTVALRDGTGFVDVEILSYSRPGQSLRSKFVWPVIGRMQQQFFEHQMDYLEQMALPNPPPPPPTTK